ncbi:MAG: sigma 54-interacting transcriptional regulator, partial [Acidobacteriota bacterium]
MHGEQDDIHGATDTRLDSVLDGGLDRAVDVRVPGLTILWHPDVDRVGERIALTGLAGGRSQELARLTPDFTPPDRPLSRPLADSRLSRTPIRLVPTPDGLRIDRDGSKTPVEIDGTPLDERHAVDAAALDRGVVLLLGHRVALLLHRLDPAPPAASSPRHDLVGESPGMLRLRRDVQRVADLGVSVLLRGETGTGKELVARALHAAGPRQDGPFVAVNMAAIPPTLAAAELFGAEKGAYTGADQKRAGHFRRADGGTLFLD